MDFYIHSAYDPPEDPGISNDDPTLTQQHFQDECDINLIMARAMQTGELPEAKPSFYGDFSDITDYQTSLNKIQRANEEFMALPASIRDRFNNDPANMILFMENSDNRPLAIEMGLIESPPEAQAVPPTTLSENG